MRVLFAHSFFLALDEKQTAIGEPYPPLGTLIAAAVARQAGHEVGLFDATFQAAEPSGMLAKIEEFQPDAVVFFEDNFHWLSKMCLARMRDASMRMIKSAAAQGLPVAVAGSDASDEPSPFLKAGARCVIRGEAEFRLLEVFSAWEQQSAIPKFPGLITNTDNDQSPPARGERNLARFPRAAWDLVDRDAYRGVWQQRGRPFSLNMTTTRGCPYRCNWCAKPIHGRRYDVRDALECAREVAFLKRDMGAQHLWFTDDIFGLKPGWVAAYADEVVRLDGVLPFKIQARADMVNADFAQGLRRAGCETVWLGVESGSQKILDAMHKDLKVEEAIAAANELQQAGIQVGFFLQFGYPGEEAADILETWKMVAKARPDAIGISVSYPLPGTPFYEMVKDQLHTVDHWEVSDYMMPLHRATFPADFYPVLFQYFHQRFNMLKQRRLTLGAMKAWVRHQLTKRRIKKFAIDGVPFS